MRVIEVVAIEVIDRGADRAAADKWIELFVVEEQAYRAPGLIGVIPADDTLIAERIVGLADSGEQHQARIVERVGGEYHQLGGLLHFTPLRIDVRDTDRALFIGIEIDPDHVGERAKLE